MQLLWGNGDVTSLAGDGGKLLTANVTFVVDWDAVNGHGKTGPGGFALDAADGSVRDATPRQAGFFHAVVSAEVSIERSSAYIDTASARADAGQHVFPADAVSAKLLVKRFGFTVEGQPPFRVLGYRRSEAPCTNQDAGPGAGSGISMGEATGQRRGGDAISSAGTETVAKSEDVCRDAVGTLECFAGDSSYWIAPILLTETQNQIGKNVRLMLERAPQGFYMDSSSGEIHAAPRLGTERAEPYVVDVVARDEAGSKALVETFTVIVTKKPEPLPTIYYLAGTNSGHLVGGVLGAVIAILLVGLVTFRRRAYRLKMAVHDFEVTLDEMLASGKIDAVQAAARSAPTEIKRKCITLVSKLGEGAFGLVWKGLYDDDGAAGAGVTEVAVKTVLDSSEGSEGAQDLLQEAVVMAQVGVHPNVVQMIGVVTSGEPMMLVLTLCKRGSLLNVLHKHLHKDEALEMSFKVRMCQDVACGMAYLHYKRFLHRDLAARNTLVDQEWGAKVADFGLSRATKADGENDDGGGDGDESQYYRSTEGVFPIRWTAPESTF